MGREVRRVPKDWQHPKNERGKYIPLFDDFTTCVAAWDEDSAAWERGEFPEGTPDKYRALPYLLNRIKEPDGKKYDCTDAVAVVASSPKKARVLASGYHGDEGPEVWLDEKRSTCAAVDMRVGGVVLSRYFNG